ncbi:hypothetical protein K439DRAFT_1639800 [Ramaria rubella]|nr:hypothetical protein K439DRAFT_1639800 [Ramaria rubella]
MSFMNRANDREACLIPLAPQVAFVVLTRVSATFLAHADHSVSVLFQKAELLFSLP